MTVSVKVTGASSLIRAMSFLWIPQRSTATHLTVVKYRDPLTSAIINIHSLCLSFVQIPFFSLILYISIKALVSSPLYFIMCDLVLLLVCYFAQGAF